MCKLYNHKQKKINNKKGIKMEILYLTVDFKEKFCIFNSFRSNTNNKLEINNISCCLT